MLPSGQWPLPLRARLPFPSFFVVYFDTVLGVWHASDRETSRTRRRTSHCLTKHKPAHRLGHSILVARADDHISSGPRRLIGIPHGDARADET